MPLISTPLDELASSLPLPAPPTCEPPCRRGQLEPTASAALLPCPPPCLQLDRIITEIVSVDNAHVTARIDAQVQACGLTYTKLSGVMGGFGNILVPLVVLAASLALLELLHF